MQNEPSWAGLYSTPWLVHIGLFADFYLALFLVTDWIEMKQRIEMNILFVILK